MSSKPIPRTPDLLLERLRLGEVSDAERAALLARLPTEGGLRERLQGLQAADAELRPLLDPMTSAVVRRLAAAAPRVPLVRARAAFATLAACAAVLVAALLFVRQRPAGEEDTRLKGGASGLVVHRKTAEGSQPLEDGARAAKGDLIQLGYRSAENRYGTILSIDGRGNVTQHLPAEGAGAAALEPGRSVPLGFAYELDDAPRFERFYLVTAPEPFAIAAVRAALLGAHAKGVPGPAPRLLLPAGFEQVVFTLDKETGR